MWCGCFDWWPAKWLGQRNSGLRVRKELTYYVTFLVAWQRWKSAHLFRSDCLSACNDFNLLQQNVLKFQMWGLSQNMSEHCMSVPIFRRWYSRCLMMCVFLRASKLVPVSKQHAIKVHGGVEVTPQSFSTLTLDGTECSVPNWSRIIPREN